MSLSSSPRHIQRTVLSAALFLVASVAAAQSLAIAHSLARQGKVDAAAAQARGVLAGSPKSAEAHELLCLLDRSIDRFDDAIRECEAARDLQPNSSPIVLELARTYGSKADHSGALTGMRMVGRIRDTFEHAAQLDPKSIDALSDLGEFYVEAPSLVGGGFDRARAVLAQLRPLSVARADRLAGMIAAKSGDFAAADAAYAAEVAIAHTPESYVDTAVYQRKRKNFTAAEAGAVLAIEKDTAHGPDTVDAAQVLIDLKRNTDAAEKALRDFLAHDQVDLVMPAAKAHTMLGQLFQAGGDSAAAHEQFSQALALAADYDPARKALRK